MGTSKTEACPDCAGGGNVRGPNPYANPHGNAGCSTCGGDGRIEVPVTSDINLVVIFDSTKFIDAGGNVNFADDVAQTVSRAPESHTQLLKCKYIMFDTEIETFKNEQFERSGRPYTLGLGDNQYLITNWKKVK